MANVQAKGQITISAIGDGRTVSAYLTATQPLTQIKTYNPVAYKPDYTKAAEKQTITPEVYVSGLTGNQINNVTAVDYTINGAAIGDLASKGTTRPWALTMSKNLDQALRIEATITYRDPVTQVSSTLKAVLSLSPIDNQGTSIVGQMVLLDGGIFRNAKDAEVQRLKAQMIRGADVDATDVTYAWSIKTASAWVDLTTANTGTGKAYPGISGAGTNTLSVKASQVINLETFKCKMTDVDASSDTYTKSVEVVESILDMTDPVMLTFESIKGMTLVKGSGASTTIRCRLWRNGEEIDKDGRLYDYSWAAWENGSAVTGKNKTGYEITINETDIAGTSITYAVTATEK